MKHEPGDKVTIKKCVTAHCFEIGEEVEIQSVHKEYYIAVNSKGMEQYIMEDDLV